MKKTILQLGVINKGEMDAKDGIKTVTVEDVLLANPTPENNWIIYVDSTSYRVEDANDYVTKDGITRKLDLLGWN